MSLCHFLCASCVMLAAGLTAVAQTPSRDDVRLSAPALVGDSLAVHSQGTTVVLVWYAGQDTTASAVLSVSSDGGRTFSSPKVLGPASRRASGPARAAIGFVSGGARGRGGSLVVAWPSREAGRDGVMLARSGDLGASFTRTFLRTAAPPAPVARSALAFGPGGRLHVLWQEGTRLLYARSDGDRLTAPEVLDEAASPCAVHALVEGAGGTLSVFWYRRFAPGDEEFAFRRSQSAGGAFGPTVRVSGERWGFQSCPAPFPSLTVDSAGAIRFLFQARLPSAGSETAFLVDRSADGRTFRPRTHVDAPGFDDGARPALAPDGEGGLSLTWDGVRNGRRYVVIRHSRGAPGVTGGIEADWMRASPPIVLDQSGQGRAAAVMRTPAGMLAAWVTGIGTDTFVATRRMTIDELCGETP